MVGTVGIGLRASKKVLSERFFQIVQFAVTVTPYNS